jgi:hypothetical protein
MRISSFQVLSPFPFFVVLTEEDRLLVLVSRFDSSMRLET